MKYRALLTLLTLSAPLRALAGFSVQQDAYDAGLFTPVEDLHSLSFSEFTALSHPTFPNYNVRIKKSDLCDGTVAAYTGYIDVEARHLFFYFFESRNDPDKDDVVFWTNGGSSSSLGLFMELGPCRVLSADGPKFHNESWNSNANIFFIDQPVGTGFSFADYGETVSTTEEGAQDIAAFVAIFFEHFTKFKGRAFHLAGESYGGRFLPVYASVIYDQNTFLVKQDMTPVNLSSVLIGNGMTDYITMLLSYYDILCTGASLPPVLDIATCVRMKTIYPRCQKWMREACIESFDGINCKAAIATCERELQAPFVPLERNMHDISKECIAPDPANIKCYPGSENIAQYLDRTDVREKLGVDSYFDGKNFTGIAFDVHALFMNNLDMYHQTQTHVAALLERDIRVLVYVGTYDFFCNWVGNEAWTLTLDWSGKEGLVQEPLREWLVEGKKAGLTRSSGPFTFATVDAAGHLVPYDKPKESLEMLNRWLAGVAL
ncbi:serine carboxypeptidase [Hymenopellis radicata]|nr:serine carboxypeptidase [Hymenopellis radicata]